MPPQFPIPNPQSPSRPPRAFTLIEILIVIGIIILLMAIVIPTVSSAKKSAQKASNVAILSALQNGLAQYYNDFNMYPPSNSSAVPTFIGTPIKPGRGSAMLAEALMGYLPGGTDGAGPDASYSPSVVYQNDPHFGFRARRSIVLTAVTPYPQGKIYGPYASDNPKSYKVNTFTLPAPADDEVFIDAYGNEILYFRSQYASPSTTPPLAPTKVFELAANQYPTNPTNASLFIADDNANDYLGISRKYPIPFANLDNTGFAQGLPLPLPNTLTTFPTPTLTPSFFNLLYTSADRKNSTNDISSTSAAKPTSNILGASSYLLISAGPDNCYYTPDDIIVAKE